MSNNVNEAGRSVVLESGELVWDQALAFVYATEIARSVAAVSRYSAPCAELGMVARHVIGSEYNVRITVKR